MDNSGTPLESNGETVAVSPREATLSDVEEDVAGGGGGGREKGYKTRREEEEEEEEESTFSDSSSEVDEHRLLSVNCGSNDMSATSARYRREQVTRVNLTQELWSDEDIDPFSFYPPLTKWDYLKVSALL